MSTDPTALLREAKRRLVPWLPQQALAEVATESPPESAEDSLALARRAVTVESPSIWAELVTDPKASLSSLEGARLAISRVSKAEARQLGLAVRDRADAVLETPVELDRFSGEVADPPFDDDHNLRLILSDGEIRVARIERLNEADLLAEPGADATIDSYSDSCGLTQAASLRLLDGRAVVDERHTTAMHLEGKSAFLAVLEAATKRIPELVSDWTELGSLEVLPEKIATRLVDLVDESVGQLKSISPEMANSMVLAPGFRCYHELSGRLFVSALSHGDPGDFAINTLASRAVKIASEASDSVATSIARTLEQRFAELLRNTAFTDAVESETEALTPTQRIRVIGTLVSPIAPVRAAELLIVELNAAVSAIQEDEDAAAELALYAVENLQEIAIRHPESVRPLLAKANYSPLSPSVAAALLTTYDLAGALKTALNDTFLSIATTASRDAAVIGVRHGTQAAPLGAPSLQAVLKGVGAYLINDASVLDELKTLLSANTRVLSKIEQVGFVATEAGVSPAVDLARMVGVRGGLEASLFRIAANALKRSPRVAERRLKYAEAWRNQGKSARSVAVEGYVKIFETVTTPVQLRVVLDSLLRFFSDADKIPGIGKLREAGLNAIARTAVGQEDTELAQVISNAIAQLRWDVKAKKPLVNRIRDRLGI